MPEPWEKHSAVNSNFFKLLEHLNHQVYAAELAEAKVEHKGANFVGFFQPTRRTSTDLRTVFKLFSEMLW